MIDVGLDVYLRRDIANALRATACASESSVGLALNLMGASAEPGATQQTGDSEKMLHAYRQGVRHALVSVGFAFGLEPVGAGDPPKPGASTTLAGLLWAESPHKP
jgi:hypothetical protein